MRIGKFIEGVPGLNATDRNKVDANWVRDISDLAIEIAHAKADAAIAEAIEKYGRSVRQKHRPVVYYLIAKSLRKGSVLK